MAKHYARLPCPLEAAGTAGLVKVRTLLFGSFLNFINFFRFFFFLFFFITTTTTSSTVSPYIIVAYGQNMLGIAGDLVNILTTYFVWDETVAQKGADEVISVCHQHIRQQLTSTAGVEHLIIHFDGCYGQANNSVFLSFCAELIDVTSPFYIDGLLRVTLKRNPVGHTFCECDTAHGAVQKRARDLGGNIHTAFTLPNAAPGLVSWQQVIETAGKKDYVRC